MGKCGLLGSSDDVKLIQESTGFVSISVVSKYVAGTAEVGSESIQSRILPHPIYTMYISREDEIENFKRY